MPGCLRILTVCLAITMLTVPVVAQKHYQKGLEAIVKERLDEAIAFFKKEVEKEKDTGKLAAHSSFLLGISYYKNKQYPEAIQYLKRAIEVYREGMDSYLLEEAWFYWLGRAYLMNGQYQEAVTWLLKAAEKAGIKASEKYDRAPKDYDLQFCKKYYVPLVPSKGGCYFWAGFALYLSGKYQDAISVLARDIEIEPNSILKSPAYETLGLCLLKLKEYDEALAAVNKAIELGQIPRPSTYTILGLIFWEKREINRAINAYKKAIEIDPRYVDAYISLASMLMSEERYSEAEDVLKKAPATPLTGINLSLCLMASGKYDEVIALSDQEIKKFIKKGIGIEVRIADRYPVVSSLWPSFPAQKEGVLPGDRIVKINNRSARNLAEELVRQELSPEPGVTVTLEVERPGESKPLNFALTSVELIDPGAASYYGIKSLAEAVSGRLKEAQSEAARAIDLEPENPWARRAECFSRLFDPAGKEKMAEAIGWLSDSNDNFDRLILTLAYSRSGDLERAARTYAAIPEDYLYAQNAFRAEFSKAARESLKPYLDSKMETIKSFESAGKLKEALDGYAEIIKLSSAEDAGKIRKHVGQLIKGTAFLTDVPEEARKHIIRAEVLSEKKEFSRAIEEYEGAKKIAPFYPEIYKSMATMHEALREYRQAIRNLNAYLELYPDAPDAREVKDKIIKLEFLLEEQKK
ncbi:MAG: tetratricopeptide repeat protein [Candidatus Saccharicenans sp.]